MLSASIFRSQSTSKVPQAVCASAVPVIAVSSVPAIAAICTSPTSSAETHGVVKVTLAPVRSSRSNGRPSPPPVDPSSSPRSSPSMVSSPAASSAMAPRAPTTVRVCTRPSCTRAMASKVTLTVSACNAPLLRETSVNRADPKPISATSARSTCRPADSRAASTAGRTRLGPTISHAAAPPPASTPTPRAGQCHHRMAAYRSGHADERRGRRALPASPCVRLAGPPAHMFWAPAACRERGPVLRHGQGGRRAVGRQKNRGPKRRQARRMAGLP